LPSRDQRNHPPIDEVSSSPSTSSEAISRVQRHVYQIPSNEPKHYPFSSSKSSSPSSAPRPLYNGSSARPSYNGSSTREEPRPSYNGPSAREEPRPSYNGSSTREEPRPSYNGSSAREEPRLPYNAKEKPQPSYNEELSSRRAAVDVTIFGDEKEIGLLLTDDMLRQISSESRQVSAHLLIDHVAVTWPLYLLCA
jgi:hypothetical protein